MNIGIAFGFVNSDSNIWDNESFQRVVFLYLLFREVKDFNVHLINFGIPYEELSKINKYYLSDLRIVKWESVKQFKYDVFIESGLKVHNSVTEFLREKGTKIVRFETENNYLIDIDCISSSISEPIIDDNYDEIWILDNNQVMNKNYLSEIYKTKIRVLPFIWSPYFIEKEKIILNNNGLIFDYLPHNKKNITIFETNDSINKVSIYPLIILEKVYNSNKDFFIDNVNKIRVINSYKYKNNYRYLSIANKLNIKKDGFCSFEDKYNSPIILSKYTDVVISTQLEEVMNNLYLDVLYGHYPLIHNIEKFKFNNNYYNSLNIDSATDKLISVLKNHDKSIIDYNVVVDKIIENYLITNLYNVDYYKNAVIDITCG